MNITVLNLNQLDWLLIAIVVYSTITAAMRGIVLEVFSLGSLIAGIFAASWYYQELSQPLVRLLQPLFHTSTASCNVLAFVIIVLGTMLVVGLIARLIRRTAHTVGLGFFDRLFGALFGIARGYLLGLVVVMAATAFFPLAGWAANSRLTPYFLQGVHAVSFVVPHGLQQKLLNGIEQLKHSGPDWIKLHS